MTKRQMEAFWQVMRNLQTFSEFHHGDCIGADDEAANIVFEMLIGDTSTDAGACEITVHPPEDNTHRAFNEHFDKILPPKTHFARNRDIVDQTDVMVACPCDMTDQPRGGTWYTVSYARKNGKEVRVVWPDGRIEVRK